MCSDMICIVSSNFVTLLNYCCRYFCRFTPVGRYATFDVQGLELSRPCPNNYTTDRTGVYRQPLHSEYGPFSLPADPTTICQCKPGFIRTVNGNNGYPCFACPLGKYKTNFGDVGTCSSCAAGSYLFLSKPWSISSPTAQGSCYSCGGNLYDSLDGAYGISRQAACSCAAGSGRDKAGDVSSPCKQCIPGTYSPVLSNNACILCPSGRYVATIGATVCSVCANAPINSGLGNTVCSSSARPTGQPTSQPTTQPTAQPTAQPTQWIPTGQPTAQPSRQPTRQPTSRPTRQPTGQPSHKPSGQPTSSPSRPTGQPTSQPSRRPTSQPTSSPSVPTGQPTSSPSMPTRQPTSQPTTCTPTGQPTRRPSSQPTSAPTSQPSGQPTSEPTGQPTVIPTAFPWSMPTSSPSMPSGRPSTLPTLAPSGVPDFSPQMNNLYWREILYGVTGFAFVIACFVYLYYFSDRRLTLKYMIQHIFGCDSEVSDHWCYCIKKSPAELELVRIERARRDQISYVPLNKLEEARAAVVDGTVYKQQRVPLSQRSKIAPAPLPLNLETAGAELPLTAQEMLAKWGGVDAKINFSNTSSKFGYRGGRGGNVEDIKAVNDELASQVVRGDTSEDGSVRLGLGEGVHASKLNAENSLSNHADNGKSGFSGFFSSYIGSSFKISPAFGSSITDQHVDGKEDEDDDDEFAYVAPRSGSQNKRSDSSSNIRRPVRSNRRNSSLTQASQSTVS